MNEFILLNVAVLCNTSRMMKNGEIFWSFIPPYKQIYTRMHTHTHTELYSLSADVLPSYDSQPDMWGVYFRHFGLNIPDLQLEHMLCWSRVAAIYRVPFCRTMAVAAEKERAVQFGTVTRQALVTTSWQAKQPLLPQHPPPSSPPSQTGTAALRPMASTTVSYSVSITVGQTSQELT